MKILQYFLQHAIFIQCFHCLLLYDIDLCCFCLHSYCIVLYCVTLALFCNRCIHGLFHSIVVLQHVIHFNVIFLIVLLFYSFLTCVADVVFCMSVFLWKGYVFHGEIAHSE